MKKLIFSTLILLFGFGFYGCGVEDKAYDRTQTEEGDSADGSTDGSESECESNQFLTADCVESETSDAALTTEDIEDSENSEEENLEE